MQTDAVTAIRKELSCNDVGRTGSHQAGICIPKGGRVLSFFPRLDTTTLNPRHHLIFHDDEDGRWEFAFIYYNNALFGGTRNEYRLTRMTEFFRCAGLKAGDSLILRRDVESGKRRIGFERASKVARNATGALILGGAWREIKI